MNASTLLCLLLLVVSAACASLTSMPSLNITNIESPSFNAAVNTLITKYGTAPLSFDAIIETE
jgi:hypothetical protein